MPISYITRNHTRDNKAGKQEPADVIAKLNEERLSLTVCLFVCLFVCLVSRSVVYLNLFIYLFIG